MTKPESKAEETETYYSGYLLVTDGSKIQFDLISEDMMDERLLTAYQLCEWEFEPNDIIWLETEGLFVPACKVIGFSMSSEEV